LPKALLGNNQASVHGPALPEWKLERILPALTARVCTFIDQAARKPEPFLLYLPLTTPHTPLAVNEAWKGKSGLNNAAADLIMETDAAVGQVLAALEKSGAAQNTLVLFTSDNGFASYVGAKELEQQGHYPSGPLRGYKSSAFEGGHREPFIVRWPAKVAAGSTCDQLVHHADLIATLAEIWGTTLPPEAGEDSFSFVPLLKGSKQPTREHAVSCAAAGTPSLRLGQWKYIAAQPAQLYDLANDLGETKNLAATEAVRLEAMKTQFEKLITAGRSTPGTPQKNDVKVRRFPATGKDAATIPTK
jgi:arylsulfatase A